MIFIVAVNFYSQEILCWWYTLVIKCSVVAILSRDTTQLAIVSGERKLYFNIFSDVLRQSVGEYIVNEVIPQSLQI